MSPSGRRRRLLLGIALAALAAGVESAALATIAPASGTAAAGASEAVLGQREILSLVGGRVSVRVKGASRFLPLTGTLAVPDESEVDASRGRVAVTVATPEPPAMATAVAYQGRFLLHQDPAAPGEAHFSLSQPLSGCGAPRLPHSTASAPTAATARHRRSSKARRLWVSDTGGHWGTNGRYVSTTVEGTRWLTLDECGRSAVKVAAGLVLVHDLLHNTFVKVAAGHQYAVARPFEEGPALMPPPGQVFTGQSGGDTSLFRRQVGKHPAVYGYFATWGQPIEAPLSYAAGSQGRLFLHISTDIGYGGGAGELISPAGIARGSGDRYLLRLGEELAASGRPAYVALLPEMNQANNAYSAFNQSGSLRGGSHSTANFKQAWRRCVLLVRGGQVAAIQRRLRALGLPPIHASQTTLPRPRVAFMWAPQTAGTPDVAANGPGAYYPGSAYVDIVGTDFYSAFPNFAGLARLYSAYPSKPFGFNEWAMWQNGDPSFVRQLFGFIRSHRRVGIMVYNQGLNPDGPFRLKRFPAAAGEIRRQLASRRFLAYAPEQEL
jgi:hypothetical protein